MTTFNQKFINKCSQTRASFFQSEDAPNISGELNHLLNYGYENIIVLVSNAYLNGGRGIINSEEIFKYCISKGLKKVIQLPMGAVGATHESIL